MSLPINYSPLNLTLIHYNSKNYIQTHKEKNPLAQNTDFEFLVGFATSEELQNPQNLNHENF